MTLNDLLSSKGVDPRQVLVLRHRPSEPKFNKVFPWLASERPDLFNIYQETQSEALERAMTGAGTLASFIGRKPGQALFIGLYAIGKSRPLTLKQFWKVPAHLELKSLGMKGFTGEGNRPYILRFDLTPIAHYADWKGKLIVRWPPPERSWWRRAHRNEMPVLAILEDSALATEMPNWDEIELSWEQLRLLPNRWQAALSQWRGIYFIYDESDAKGYVGSAYGGSNLLGRWLNYSTSGHGGNTLLKKRDPKNFRFSILQRVSPDMESEHVIRLESTWKQRLHTRSPFGLNEN